MTKKQHTMGHMTVGKSKKPPQQVLVLGANGKLGIMLRSVWKGRRETVWQSRRPVAAAGQSVLWRPGDGIDALPRVDAIVALWGVTPGAGRTLGDNSSLALEAMRLGSTLGAARVLHCSSAAVYAPSDLPLHETDTIVPPSVYGQSKLEMEQAVAGWQKCHAEGPKACMMRIGNVAGADSLFAALKRGGVITLDQFEDAQGPRRSYIGASDFGRCLEALLACPLAQLPEVVNIAARETTAMEDLIRTAGGRFEWQPAAKSAVPQVALATDILRRLIDLGPQASDAAALVSDWQTYGATA